jgi:hypothetical protein
MVLDDIVDHGTYKAPESDDDLLTAKKLTLEYIALGKRDNLADDRLQLLRNFNQQIDDLNQAAQPPPMAPPGAQPQASPEAPPTSDLIQNMPGMTPGQPTP